MEMLSERYVSCCGVVVFFFFYAHITKASRMNVLTEHRACLLCVNQVSGRSTKPRSQNCSQDHLCLRSHVPKVASQFPGS